MCTEIVAWAMNTNCTSVKNHNPEKFRSANREPGWCGRMTTGEPYRSENQFCEKHRQNEDDETKRERINMRSFPPPPLPNNMKRLMNPHGKK
jgi:hypothetical protein